MAKLNEKYESVIVFSAKLGEEGVEDLKNKVNALITKNATIDSVDDWGKRRLAYEIQDETEGYYVLYNFTSTPDFPLELDRVLKITDGVLRALTTVKVG